MIHFSTITFRPISPFITLATTTKGLCYLQPSLTEEAGLTSLRHYITLSSSSLHILTKQPTKLLTQALHEVRSYLTRSLTTFTTPLDLSLSRATDFQLQVWKSLLLIPFGTTQTYSQVARIINSPKAYRAVGSANGKNPICLIIPCHRVVAVVGMGGYSGGLEMKELLLQLEQ